MHETQIYGYSAVLLEVILLIAMVCKQNSWFDSPLGLQSINSQILGHSNSVMYGFLPTLIHFYQLPLPSNVQRVRDFEAFIPKWDIFVKALPLQGVRELCRRRQKDCKSQRGWMTQRNWVGEEVIRICVIENHDQKIVHEKIIPH